MKYIVLDEAGPPCPRCSQATQVREHAAITEKHTRRQPFYYSRWYRCLNPNCKTTLIMPEQYKVWNLTEAERERLRLVLEQLGEAADLETLYPCDGRNWSP